MCVYMKEGRGGKERRGEGFVDIRLLLMRVVNMTSLGKSSYWTIGGLSKCSMYYADCMHCQGASLKNTDSEL